MRRVLHVVVAVVVWAVLAGCQNRNADERQPQASREAKPTLYERLGGEPAIRAVIDDFVPRAAANPKVNFARKNVPGVKEWEATPKNVQHVKDQLVAFVAQATGGPQKYTGEDMRTSHKGMKITHAEFDAIAADLKASLDKLNVPAREQEELLAIVGSTRGDIVEVK